jgi:hypothetical protein
LGGELAMKDGAEELRVKKNADYADKADYAEERILHFAL